MECDPVKRLRSTQIPRSPGGTPAVNPSKATVYQSTDSLTCTDPFNSPEPMHSALLHIMNHKFRNVHSPSPSPAQSRPDAPDAASPQTFSP